MEGGAARGPSRHGGRGGREARHTRAEQRVEEREEEEGKQEDHRARSVGVARRIRRRGRSCGVHPNGTDTRTVSLPGKVRACGSLGGYWDSRKHWVVMATSGGNVVMWRYNAGIVVSRMTMQVTEA